jgi:hypothetical protein
MKNIFGIAALVLASWTQAHAASVVITDSSVIVDISSHTPEAVLAFEAVKTKRVPEDGRTYGLPPNMGALPLALARNANQRFVKGEWVGRDVVLMPVANTQAMWFNFTDPTRFGGYHGANSSYPFAMIIGTGKVNAISGDELDMALKADAVTSTHNYIVTGSLFRPGHQRWLDGYKTGPKEVRQFVATSRGSGTSIEEYLTGSVRWGGIQIVVYPLKRNVWERVKHEYSPEAYESEGVTRSVSPEVDMSAGGKIDQVVEFPHFMPSDYDQSAGVRFWVTMVDHDAWPLLTGSSAPAPVVTPAPTPSPFAKAPGVGMVEQNKKW